MAIDDVPPDFYGEALVSMRAAGVAEPEVMAALHASIAEGVYDCILPAVGWPNTPETRAAVTRAVARFLRHL